MANPPNKQSEVERFSGAIDGVLDSVASAPGSIQDILRLTNQSFAAKKAAGRPILDAMIADIDRPILKNMARDVVTVMSNWFEDPQLLCCLVQGLYGLFLKSSYLEQANKGIKIAETDFAKWMDVLITFIDVIIVLLNSQVRKLTFVIPDFIKEVMNGVIGAILLVLQELLFTIRDSVINELLRIIDSQATTQNIWAKCLPLSQLLEILRKYINDFGLFAELFEKIKGFISAKVGDFGVMKQFDFPNNIKDLEFLYWFRDLLIKMKAATLSFDLCFLPQSNGVGGLAPGTPQVPPESPLTPGVKNYNPSGTGAPKLAQGITIAGDGTILQDKAGLKSNSLPVLTNSSVRGFLNKYYGYPLDVVDSLIVGSTSADNIHGTNITAESVSSLNADCPNSPTPADVVKWALGVRNRNI